MLPNVLQSELDGLLGQLAAQNNPQPPVTETAPVTSVVEPAPATPVASTPAAPAPAPVDAPIDLDAVIDSWDSTPVESVTTAPVAPQPTVNHLSELAKVLNVQKDEEILKVVEAYKQKAQVLEAIPEDLGKALEIAKDGGDYLEYLKISVVDWSKEDPITLYENYVIDQYTDPNTKLVDTEKVDKLLDRIDDDDKELRGKELQRSYMNFQSQRKNAIENDARAQKQKFETTLRQAVDAVDNIAGFKLTSSHKAELYNYIMSGQDLRPQDLQARVIDAGLKKYWGKMDNFRKDQIKNATTRQMLESTTFPKLNATSTPSQIDGKPKQYGMEDYIKELEVQRGFVKRQPQ